MKIYSLSLFRHPASAYESPLCGTSRGIFYTNFLPTVVRAFRAVYPDWHLRIHHSDGGAGLQGPYSEVLKRMHDRGFLQLVSMGPATTLCGSMLWRLAPIWDPEVEYVACRDIDSLPMPRERVMLEQFITTGKAVNAILDSESHYGPLMGGMIAFHAPKFRAMFPDLRSVWDVLADSCIAGIDLNQHGADQRVMNRSFWPRLKRDALIHQRMNIVQHPDVETMPAAPQLDPADLIVNHVGAGYDMVKAFDYFDPLPSSEAVRQCEQ